MTVHEHSAGLARTEDRQLVDLLASVLVDPNLHTDARLRLHDEIETILRGAHDDIHGAAGRDRYRRALETHGGRFPEVLESVLVDPNLHTDSRLRLHDQIAEILANAQEAATS
ncbi:MAG TPA: hypothetical protein VMA77_26505 [Solirubrobacteraceae bacterium]|nr:hypothetical protein [Solirubrobacteraceae bacterium]